MADGDGGGGFLEQLPEELRAEPSLQGYKDLPTMAKSLVETKKLVGSSIRPPGPDAGPEAWKAFADKLAEKVPGVMVVPENPEHLAAVQEQLWGKLGRPADEKGYSLEGLDIPEGVAFDAEKFKATAKEMGWTKGQAEKFAKAAIEERKAALAERTAADKALRAELGAAYEDRVAAARDAAKKAGMPEAEAAALPPSQIRYWANMAKAVGGEGRPLAEQGKGGTQRMTPAEAQAALLEIRSRPEFFRPHLNPALSEQLQKRSLELTAMAYPDEAA